MLRPQEGQPYEAEIEPDSGLKRAEDIGKRSGGLT